MKEKQIKIVARPVGQAIAHAAEDKALKAIQDQVKQFRAGSPMCPGFEN